MQTSLAYKNLLFACLFGLLANPLQAQTEDSDCVFEFNQAYELNQSASNLLDIAEQYTNQSDFKLAKKQYQLAIDLFQKVILNYRALSKPTKYCSATNISLSKDNIRLAEENLKWAQAELLGLDCLKTSNDIETLRHKALDHYHKNNDIQAAQQTIAEAQHLSNTTIQNAICKNDHQQLLIEQLQDVNMIAETIKNQNRHELCLATLEKIHVAKQHASN